MWVEEVNKYFTDRWCCCSVLLVLSNLIRLHDVVGKQLEETFVKLPNRSMTFNRGRSGNY